MKTKLIVIGVAIAVISAAFWAGQKYEQLQVIKAQGRAFGMELQDAKAVFKIADEYVENYVKGSPNIGSYHLFLSYKSASDQWIKMQVVPDNGHDVAQLCLKKIKSIWTPVGLGTVITGMCDQ